MIATSPDFEALRAFQADICVIGAGPIGILTAIALNDAGFKVLLLESGFVQHDPAAQALSEAENLRPENHHPPETAVARRLGGTSNLWGGRCLPFDAIDYEARPWLDCHAWPVSAEELAPWIGPACVALGAASSVDGAVYDAPLAGVGSPDSTFGYTSLERWSNVPRTQVLHRSSLEMRPGLLVALGATVLGFKYADDRIVALDVHVEARGRDSLPVKQVILSAGGNESTRLLLAEQSIRPDLFGGRGGPLGRYYMGHVVGQIADIVFHNRALHDGLQFHVDENGSYVRRRLVPSNGTQKQLGIANVAFWPVVPPIADPRHRSGPLSAVFLGLTITPLARRLLAEPIRLRHTGPPPYKRGPHVLNVLRDLPRTLGFLPWFLWHNRVARLRLPGLFVQNSAQRYGLEYHSEHLPSSESRLTLSDTTDRLGLPRLAIDLRFSEADAASVVKTHDALEKWLTRNQLGVLSYRVPAEKRAAAVLEEAFHGAHQVGTIRMGNDRVTSIVDANCRSFDIPNLHVVSTAVLPTSGQANPTMTAAMLGLRLAGQLSRSLRPQNVSGGRVV